MYQLVRNAISKHFGFQIADDVYMKYWFKNITTNKNKFNQKYFYNHGFIIMVRNATAAE